MKVVIIGPGKVGAGHLAPLFVDAGWAVTFATRTPQRAARIASTPRYTATVVAPAERSGCGGHRWVIERPRAVPIESEHFNRAVSDADLICTAVGAGNVLSLAGTLANALACRPVDRPIDLWVVENGDCAPALAVAVQRIAAGRGLVMPPAGFAGAVATVAVARGCWEHAAPDFVGDDDRGLIVDETNLCRPVAPPAGVSFTRHYRAQLMAKLRVFNAGHAVCAYLGWLLGYADVANAIADPLIRPKVAGAMIESRAAVLTTYPALGADVHGPVSDALLRFTNRALADPILRVARDPVRKLACGDRLVGPMLSIHQATGSVPAYFPLGIAAALLFDPPEDAQAQDLQRRLRDEGVLSVLRATSNLEPDDPAAIAIADSYRNFILDDDVIVFPPARARSGTAQLQGHAR